MSSARFGMAARSIGTTTPARLHERFVRPRGNCRPQRVPLARRHSVRPPLQPPHSMPPSSHPQATYKGPPCICFHHPSPHHPVRIPSSPGVDSSSTAGGRGASYGADVHLEGVRHALIDRSSVRRAGVMRLSVTVGIERIQHPLEVRTRRWTTRPSTNPLAARIMTCRHPVRGPNSSASWETRTEVRGSRASRCRPAPAYTCRHDFGGRIDALDGADEVEGPATSPIDPVAIRGQRNTPARRRSPASVSPDRWRDAPTPAPLFMAARDGIGSRLGPRTPSSNPSRHGDAMSRPSTASTCRSASPHQAIPSGVMRSAELGGARFEMKKSMSCICTASTRSRSPGA